LIAARGAAVSLLAGRPGQETFIVEAMNLATGESFLSPVVELD
jgi:hypothetical protein